MEISDERLDELICLHGQAMEKFPGMSQSKRIRAARKLREDCLWAEVRLRRVGLHLWDQIGHARSYADRQRETDLIDALVTISVRVALVESIREDLS